MADEKRQIDPQPLSLEYHKAHKQLMLWAAILFIWELVGIDLEKAKESGGNVGAIINAIKSPQAVPWALIILIAYLLFKTTVEWYQCSAPRRTLRVAKIDFAAAWIVPLFAYALYFYQRIRQVQVADVVQQGESLQFWAMMGFIAGLAIAMDIRIFLAKRIPDWKESGFRWTRRDGMHGLFYAALLSLFLMLPWVVSKFYGESVHWRVLFGAFAVGPVVYGTTLVFAKKVLPILKRTAVRLNPWSRPPAAR